ncbi:MAG: hypothetical protein EKK32_32280 [Bradyrhizobiaceae bacterium]|nr:MAG: hypothetical protein EKK32_32280 [Bradyrhizobiaceae bacterium]
MPLCKEVVSGPSEPGRRFLVNGITVNKFAHPSESVIPRDALSPILPSFEESRFGQGHRPPESQPIRHPLS